MESLLNFSPSVVRALKRGAGSLPLVPPKAQIAVTRMTNGSVRRRKLIPDTIAGIYHKKSGASQFLDWYWLRRKARLRGDKESPSTENGNAEGCTLASKAAIAPVVGLIPCCRGGSTAWRVVAVASAGDKLAPAMRRNHLHADRSERSVLLGVGRIVGQGVLVADIVRDLLADGVHVINAFRKKRQAARCFGDMLQRFHGVIFLFPFFVAEQTDGVNHRVRLLDFPDSFFKRVMAGIVLAVRDHEQHALVLGGFLQMIERADNGVKERRAAARIDALQ